MAGLSAGRANSRATRRIRQCIASGGQHANDEQHHEHQALQQAHQHESIEVTHQRVAGGVGLGGCSGCGASAGWALGLRCESEDDIEVGESPWGVAIR